MAKSIILRKLKDGDAGQLAAIANNKKIADNLRNMFPHPYTLEDAKWFINFDKNESPDHRWCIEYDQKCVGVIGLHVKDDVYSKNLELGYWIGEEFWGKGIGSAAIKESLSKGFNELKCNRIYASVFDYNPASMRILEKNGFVKEGTLRESIYKKGEFYNEVCYGIIRKDFIE